MPQQLLWRTGPGPVLVAETGALRLVVQQADSHARFQVLRTLRDVETCPQLLLASGTEADIRAAMAAAERTLGQFELRPSAALSA